MKKITLTLKMLLFVALLATWSSCSKSDDNEIVGPTPVTPTPNTPDTPTPSEPDDPYMTVCEHVAEVANSVDVFYDKCNSIEELDKYLDDIKKIEYVEDAYTNSTTMFVRIKDYGHISYSFYPEFELISNDELNQVISNAKKMYSRSAKGIVPKPFLDYKKICIANTQFVEDKMTDRRLVADATRHMAEFAGYKAIVLDAPGLTFFNKTMYEYDIVLLITHGYCDPYTGLHWMQGSEHVNKDDLSYSYFSLDFGKVYQYKDIPTYQITFDKNKEYGWRLMVSEKYISANDNKVSDDKKDKPIFLNVACQSMMFNNSLANIFIDKGFGAYFGYDESNYWGQRTYFYFISKLLSGQSLENAYNDLPDDYKKEPKPEKANLNYVQTKEQDNFMESCIVKPTIRKEDNSTENELKIDVFADTFFFNHRLEYISEEWKLYQDALFSYGFYLSETKNIKDAEKICNLTTGNQGFSYNTPYVSFQYTLSYKSGDKSNIIKPETTYYYWAYIFDGKDYYLSDMDSFTTGSVKVQSTNSGSGELPNVPGSDL